MGDGTPPAKRPRYNVKYHDVYITFLTFNRLSFSGTFDVLVGPADKQKCFTLRHDVFVPRAEFFRAGRSSQWCKDTKQPTKLEYDDPEVFQNYLHCVYSGDIPALTCGEDSSKEEHDEHFNALVRLYVLADTFGDLGIANLVIDAIYHHSCEIGKLPLPSFITHAYENTVPRSPLRAMIRDFIVHKADRGYLDNYSPHAMHIEVCHDFVVEFLTIKRKTRFYAQP